MPRFRETIDGVEYTLDVFGATKILSIRGDGFVAERVYIGESLTHEEMVSAGRIEIRKYRAGKLHADRSPAVYVRAGTFSGEYWFKQGIRHRADGPAIMETNNGVKYAVYYNNGQRGKIESARAKTTEK